MRLFLMIENVPLDRAQRDSENRRDVIARFILRANERNPIKNNNERYTVVILYATLAVTLGVGWRWQQTNIGRYKFGYRICSRMYLF